MKKSMKASSQDVKPALLTRTYQFKDPALEHRFNAVKINQDLHISKLLLAVIALVLSILLSFDQMVIKAQYWPGVALVWRGGLVAGCVIAIFMFHHLKNNDSFRIVLLLVTAVILANLQAMVFIYKDNYFLHVLFDIVIIIAIYFSTLFSFVVSVCLCSIYALAGFFIIYTSKDIDAYSLFIVGISYLATNLTGLIISIHEHTLKRRFYHRKESLQNFAADMKNMAYQDPLTKISNRRAFYESFSTYQRMTSRFRGTGSEVCFVLADIDYFKKINDEYGHDVGDQVLVCFADFLKNSIRPTDQVYRFGGEEFLLIFGGCCVKSAIQRTEELIHALDNKPLQFADFTIPITASFGLAVLKELDTDISVVSRADKALYQAKRSGRNRLCVME